jgi:hypothetical protein
MTMHGKLLERVDPGSRAGRRPRGISVSRLQRLLAKAQVLEQDAHGPKVVQLPSGAIVKLFRRKRRLSSAAWRPYGLRFVHNAAGLQRRGVPTVRVRGFFHCPEAGRHVVVYRPLVGDVLRHCLERGETVDWIRLAHFLAQLHQHGIYFRSLHSGNIVRVADGGFGLIDVADLQLLRKPLGLARRTRNLRPLLRDGSLGQLRLPGLFGQFIEAYCEAAGMAPLSTAVFRRLAWRQWARDGAQSSERSASGSASAAGSR